MRKVLASLSVVLAVLFLASVPAHAQLSGAIFTTNSNGSEVNGNIYPSKDAVYLDGGPPPGAPQTAAGLPDGTYVFQVTDPSGKKLLSLDIANCRQFTVANGIITGVVNVGGCQHVTGVDIDHNAVTVQLMPTPTLPTTGVNTRLGQRQLQTIWKAARPLVSRVVSASWIAVSRAEISTDSFRRTLRPITSK